MAVTPLFTCVCGIQKKTTNHWVLAEVTGSDIRFMPWDSKLALRDDIIVLCGEGCATALLSRSLGEWKNAAQNSLGPRTVISPTLNHQSAADTTKTDFSEERIGA